MPYSEAAQIRKRIAHAPAGTVFTPADFSDLAGASSVNASLSRLTRSGVLSRVRRGVYSKPKVSKVLGQPVPAKPDEVAQAIAKQNGWAIAPAGASALNFLGLDTQVPAAIEYASSGPYKSYECDGYRISFKHRASRDLIGCSPLTRLVIQALRALGKEGATPEVAARLATRMSEPEVAAFCKETAGSTSWIVAFGNQLREAKGC